MQKCVSRIEDGREQLKGQGRKYAPIPGAKKNIYRPDGIDDAMARRFQDDVSAGSERLQELMWDQEALRAAIPKEVHSILEDLLCEYAHFYREQAYRQGFEDGSAGAFSLS